MGVFAFYLMARTARTYMTDAPTTSWVAVQVAVEIAVSLSMFDEVFDVHAAFLSGMPDW